VSPTSLPPALVKMIRREPGRWLLDAHCGVGGAGRGYQRAGFKVVGVDVVDQPRYAGNVFVRASALDVIAGHGRLFAGIHTSPPCQASSASTKGNRARGWADSHADLIPATRALCQHAGRPYVIENVAGSAIRRDLMLCGLHFDLGTFRHRYFELGGWEATTRMDHPSHTGHRVAGYRHGARHDGDMVAPYGDGGGKGSLKDWARALGIDWTLDPLELREAIPPAYGEHIGRELVAWLTAQALAWTSGRQGVLV
jgi:hypothetical protein